MNPIELLVSQKPWWVFVAVFLRVMPVFWLAPPAHVSAVPKKVRVLLAMLCSILLTPAALSEATLPVDAASMLLSAGGELLLGVVLGSTFLLTIVSMQLAGQIVSQLAGVDQATTLGPDSQELSVVANLFGWIAMVVLLTSGGHRWLIECCLDSLHSHPVGSCRFDSSWLQHFDSAVSHCLTLGFRLALPVGLVLLMTNVLVGLIARVLPQFNTLSVGLGLNVLVLLCVLFVAVGGVSWAFQSELAGWLERCRQLAVGS